MGKVCKNIRAKWTSESMEAAIKAVQRGRISQREAASRYGIPRRTLRQHLKTGSIARKLGRTSLLLPAQEIELVERIVRLANIGYPITPKMMRHQVYRFMESNKIKHNFNENKQLAGRGWFRLFMKRHPELAKRKAQAMNAARAQKMNRFIVKDYFTKLNEIYETMGLKNKPERIYNMDEKGCRLTIHHQQTVLARKGTKRLHLIAPEHAENVTVVACVSATGNVMPPMILFKGKRMKPEFEDNLPAGALVKMSPKGSMTTELFIEFINHMAKYKVHGPILLIFDGAACHLDYSIVDAAEKHEILLFCLPSNTTHELQPLDKSVYRAYEAYWDQEVLNYWDRHPERRLTKTRFNKKFSTVWSRCMTHENIINGFRSTGIYPFDPCVIPSAAFAPSLPSEIPLDDNSDSDDNIPLAKLKSVENDKNTSFHELMSTPETYTPVSNVVRRKAINYKAQQVTKALFKENNLKLGKTEPGTSKETSKDEPLPSTSKQNQNDSSWYCPVCNICAQYSMRMCVSCHTWMHEHCIGYTSSDDEDFECISCSK